jgi:hypothetical protein
MKLELNEEWFIVFRNFEGGRIVVTVFPQARKGGSALE